MRGDVSSNRALRSLVGEMAALGDEDLRAILDPFDADDRSRLMDLIESFRRGETPVEAAPVIAGLSDWLTLRLDDASIRHSGMTEHAVAALRSAAAMAGPGVSRRSASPAGSNWLAGLRLRP